MKDRKNMAMIIIIGIIISSFLFVNSTVFATTGTVLTSDLRLRKEGNSSSEIMDVLDENDKVEILGEDGDWYKVKANGKVGYVSKQYIKVKEENTTNNEATPAENTEGQQPSETENQPNVEENKTEEPKTSQDNVEQPKKGKCTAGTELKIVPLINGIVVNAAQDSEVFDVVSTVGLWSYVKSDSKAGWVLTDKVVPVAEENKAEETTSEENNSEPQQQEQTEQSEEKKEEKSSTEKLYSKAKTYYVKGTSVNARSEANKSSDVVKVLNTNNSVKVTGEDGDWYIVNINGDKAYIAKSLLSTEKVEVTSRSSNSLEESNQSQEQQSEPEASAPSNSSGAAIVAYAKQFLGYRYVYGTNGPNTFDCSGFVQYVYKHFGYSLSRSSSTQANDGVAVSKNNLEPGDVLIFRDTSNSRIGHVGLYIGGGQFIHASNSRTGVIISDLSSASYQKRYVGARRIL